MTNFERIKNMKEKEMAIWLAYVNANIQKTGNSTITDREIKENLYWLMTEVE